MNLTQIIGLIAAFCTTVAFVPQVLKLWRTKSAEDLSLSMFVIFSTGVGLWLVYGLLISDIPIILANTITLMLCLVILILRQKYHREKK